MTYKISILTPVHISSGNKNACFLYHPDKNDHFNCYRIEDLLQFIPPQKLLELQPDNASNNGKKDIIKLFNNYINYNQLKPQYFLFYKFKPFSKDVTEQVKSLNKPYIPGSSIKGAIMNAIIFNLLNDNKEKIKEFKTQLNNNNIIQVHRSYLINLDFVYDVNSKFIILRNKKEINIGKTYKKKFKLTYQDYLLNGSL